MLRAAGDPVRRADFDAVWDGRAQLDRALDGLVADGLVDPLPDGRFALPDAARAHAGQPGSPADCSRAPPDWRATAGARTA